MHWSLMSDFHIAVLLEAVALAHERFWKRLLPHGNAAPGCTQWSLARDCARTGTFAYEPHIRGIYVA